ncbi:uncharacterized protein [Macrobrachium rosenbergii]|uniref:uncharacterized protein n=1 Tax=Macrobrachium rosenbergii TaxID=79674 RepID=UPI0034D6E5C9
MEHIEEIKMKGFPVSRVYHLCKKCRRVFYDQESAEEHLLTKCRNELNKKPSDVIFKKPSQHSVKNKRIRLTYGNEWSKCQSSQSDEANQGGSNSYVCPICKESFPLDQQLKKHMKIHARRFLCKACGKTFSSAWWMKQHSLVYCKSRLVVCRRCGRALFGIDALRRHCEVHFRDVYYICGLCGENHEKNLCYKNKKSTRMCEIPLTVNSHANGILQQETYHKEQSLSYAKLGSPNELIAFTKPQFFHTTGNPSTFQEVALLVKIPLFITANSCAALEGVSSEGASHLSETANPGAFLGDSSTVKLSSSSATANPRNAWERASLDPSVSSDTAPQTLYLEGAPSQIFPSSFETTCPRISQEGEAPERDSSQIIGAEFGKPLGCETLEIPSTITEIDNAIACFEHHLLDTPSTEVVNPSSILEGSMLMAPSPSETENHVPFLEEALIGKNTFSCEILNSCVIHERAQYDKHAQITSVADQVTIMKTSLKKSTLLNESPSSGSLLNQAAESKLPFISETDNQSYFSENAVLQNRMNLELPASMYHLGIQLEDCNLHNVFGDLDMDEMSSPTREDSTDIVTNEGDNVSLRSEQADMLITDNELTNGKYENEMCNRRESHFYEKSNNLDISDENPEDYYLDSLEALRFLYE